MPNKNYEINITNGQGSKNILKGTYDVTANINGYDNTSIDPKSITVNDDTNTITFTISGNATLTIHVTETGTTTGTAIKGAKFQRCDSLGTILYGNPITSDETGNANFEHLPYNADNSVKIYYKQIESDGEHEFDKSVKMFTMNEQTATTEIQNPIPSLKTITITDQYYSNVTDINGTININTQ